jgi:hypothetical protein
MVHYSYRQVHSIHRDDHELNDEARSDEVVRQYDTNHGVLMSSTWNHEVHVYIM